MAPTWLQALSAVFVPLAIVSALLVAADTVLLRHRHRMPIMDVVWPLTMLYWGPAGLLFYAWFGRGMLAEDADGENQTEPPMWQAAFNGATHCGAGFALGDFIGDETAFATGFRLIGSELGGKYTLAFVFAYLFGIIFQYFSVAPMRGLGLRDGLLAAVKIDTLSLLAYQAGMFAWMGFRVWLFPDLLPTSWTYWLMAQVAMVLGFATTYPVNWWLVSRGIKQKM